MKANPLLGPRSNLAARGRYEVLLESVTRAINEADPKSLLEFGAPPDEYLTGSGHCGSARGQSVWSGEVRAILHEEFERWFGEGSVGPAKPSTRRRTVSGKRCSLFARRS